MTDGLALLMGILVVGTIPLLVWVVRRIQEEHWRERAGLGSPGAMSDAQFEDWVEGLFTKLGYRVEQARGRESLGVDWILTDPRGFRTAVQTRRWRQDVGPEAVERIVGGAVYHRCDERLVITTASFTAEARRLGRQTETYLWGIRELAGAVKGAEKGLPFELDRRTAGPERPAEPAPRPEPVAAAPEPRPNEMVAAASEANGVSICPRCGKSMVRRSVNGRPVMVCAAFPRCTGARID